MEGLGSAEITNNSARKVSRSKIILFVTFVFLLLLASVLFLLYIFTKRDARSKSVGNAININDQLYSGEGFNKALVKDEVWQGYQLRGYTDGEIISNEFDISGIPHKNILAFRLYYLNKELVLNSVIIPLIISGEEGWVITDQASQSGFKEQGIENNEEKYNYFSGYLKGKENKILTVSLRPNRETEASEDWHWEIWNQYYSYNEKAYSDFVNSGVESIAIILPRALASNLVKDSFIHLDDKE